MTTKLVGIFHHPVKMVKGGAANLDVCHGLIPLLIHQERLVGEVENGIVLASVLQHSVTQPANQTQLMSIMLQ